MIVLWNRIFGLFGIMDGSDVAPTALIITVCSVVFAAIITLVVILAVKNKKP